MNCSIQTNFKLTKCSHHHIKICPDFIEFNNCLSTKCHLPHVKLNNITNHVHGGKAKKRKSSMSTGVDKKRKILEKAQTLAEVNLIKPKLIHSPSETLDFIPLSTSPLHDYPMSPLVSSESCSSDDCDLSILPKFIANMIKTDYEEDE